MKTIKHLLFFSVFILGLLLLRHSAFATNYYVDGVNGNDNNSGTSINNAFKTIRKIVFNGAGAPVLAPGDNINIAAGTYRERLSIINRTNGTANNPITVRSYNGEVRIDGSAAVTSWTKVAGEIYKATPGFAVRAVVIDNTPLYPVAALGTAEGSIATYDTYAKTSGLWAESRYLYEPSTGDLYVWAPGGGNPASHSELGVINTAHDTSLMDIMLWDMSYWVFDSLTLQFGDEGIYVDGDAPAGVTLKNSIVRYHNWSGVTNVNIALNNSVYHSFMNNWPRGRWPWIWGGWGGGLTVNPNGGLAENNLVYMNGGEGILVYNSKSAAGGTIVRNNTVYNNWSMQLYFDNFPNGLMERNFAYSIPDNAWKTNNGQIANDYDISKRLRGTGIGLANEDYYQGYCALDNVMVRNNIVVGARQGIVYLAEGACSTVGLHNAKIYNNTFVVPNAKQPGLTESASTDNYKGFQYNWVADTVGNEFKNNIIYASDPWSWTIVHTGNNSVYSGFVFDNNLIYHSSRASNIYWNTPMTHATWLGLSGPSHGIGDVTSDPKLVFPYGFTAASCNLSDNTSPAINVGADLSAYLSTDYLGTSRPQSAAFDIGAYEYVSGAPIDTTAPAAPSGLSVS